MTNNVNIQHFRIINMLYIILRKTPLRMKISAIMLFLAFGVIHAVNSYGQSTLFSLSMKNQTVQDVLENVEKQTQFKFFYNNNQVDVDRKVSINIKQKNVFEMLDKLFEGTDITYSVIDKNIILSTKEIIASNPPNAQQFGRLIKGKVTDEKGEAIIGANVLIKGTTNGTITDIDGQFSLEANDSDVIQISFIGYLSQEIPVGNKSSFNVSLREDAKNLDEVVVTALGIKKSEKALGYSVQKVGGDELTTVKGTDMATSLTGKIAGVTVLNKTDFNTAPVVLLRGETPLLVIDGIPFENTTLSDIAADDIESISVLKGATASALYGSKGAAGALMITTKRGQKEGLNISVNSNTMFNMGYLAQPEVQSAYSSGSGGKYLQEKSEFIWGDKLDIGRTALQYDPYTYEWREMPLVSKGKDNFENFLETSFVTNNNINVTYKGKDGSVRTSLTHLYNKGQFPGNKLNKFTYSVAGDMKVGKFSMDASMTYNVEYSPQTRGSGYSGLGYMYNMIVWTGTEFDVRDFKNYWIKDREDVEQNWHYDADYNNPYFIANEITSALSNNRANAQFNVNYEITDWLKATARAGSDFYSKRVEDKTPLSVRNSFTGGYSIGNDRAYSATGDFLLLADKKVGDFNVGGLLGGGITFKEENKQLSYTRNGLTVPGFYSLKSSVDAPYSESSVKKKQTNSIYGKVEVSWRSAIFLEATGRNDWVSTLDKSERSYFYPSVSGSAILTELFSLPDWLSFWKLRGSWTITKEAAKEYKINKVYKVTHNAWDGMSSAAYPLMMRDETLRPQQSKAFEVGTGVNFLNNRLRFDLAFYNKLFYDIQHEGIISKASGFEKSLINYGEERIKKGWEITIGGDVFKTKEFDWISTFNWSRDRYSYHKIDPTYSTDKPWVKPGERWDWLGVTDWERDPDGNIIHSGGLPVLSNYQSKIGYARSSWVWGFTNHLRYKNFTFDISFDGRVGGKAYNRLEQAMWNSGTHINSDTKWRYDEVVNGNLTYVGQGVKVVSGSVKYDTYGNILEDTRVFAPNDEPVSYEAYTKRYHPWNGSPRSQNIQDLTFFKLRELAIGYKIPTHVIKKIGLNSAHISLVGQNLFLWTKEFKYSDPDGIYEDHSETLNPPSMRYVGMNVKFDF